MPSAPDVPESHRDLLDARGTAALTTVDGQGRPQTTAVWYLLRGGELFTSVTDSRQKYKNLARTPHCTLFIIDPQNPFRTLEIRAEAELIHDPDKSEVKAIAVAYGVDPAPIMAVPGERYKVVLLPRRIVVNPPA